MSVSADMSLMDLFFDKDDPVLKFPEDHIAFRQEFDTVDVKTDLFGDKIFPDADDLIQHILNDEQFDTFLDKNIDDHQSSHFDIGLCGWKQVTTDGSGIKEVVVGSGSSTYSDSGLSSDQVSPGLPNDYEFTTCHQDDDDEHLSSAVSTISESSVHQITSQSQDMDFMDTTEDEQAVLGILPQDTQVIEPKKKKMRQVVNVSPMVASNPKSILLPVKTGNGIRTYKIVNEGNGRKTLKAIGSMSAGNQVILKALRPVGMPLIVKNLKNSNASKKFKARQVKVKTEETDEEEEITVISESEDDKGKTQYPRLILSPEEKKLMQKEGITLPSHYPLTKFEERELKRIRRKIRNKISAQDSRKRKKEYLDGLEDRVKQCTEENLTLVKKIKFLQSQNQSLMAQLKKLQMTLARTTTKTAQPATCLMVIMLSVALIMAPNLRLTQNNDTEVVEQDITVTDETLTPTAGRTRSLLSKPNLQDECLSVEEDENKLTSDMHDLLRFQHPRSSLNSPKSHSDFEGSNPSIKSERSRKSSYGSSSGYDSPPHFLADHDYDPPPSKRHRFDFDDQKIHFDYYDTYEEEIVNGKKDFIIPPVDDVWPEKMEEALKPKEFIIPEVDDDWIPNKSILMDKIETMTTEVKVNISDSKGTRTVVIQVPKEKK